MQADENVAGARGKYPRVNVKRSLADVIKDVERLEKNHKKGLAIFEKLLWELYAIERAAAGRDDQPVQRRPPRQAPAPAGPLPAIQDCEPRGGKVGRTVVTFDSTKQVELPATLAELVRILISAEGESPDELVPWKSFDRIGALLEKRLGRTFNHHTVSQLLTRLRKKFVKAGVDVRLVDSSTVLGARLRLKRCPPAGAICAG